MKQVIIMRGIPGSGKSTWIKKNITHNPANKLVGVKICSADFFHIGDDNVYRFDPADIGKAHDFCLNEFLGACQKMPAGIILVVDNTNLLGWEIAPYYRLAQLFGWDVKIVRLDCDFRTAVERNIHAVASERIWQMYQSLLNERLPLHWKEEIVFPTLIEIERG